MLAMTVGLRTTRSAMRKTSFPSNIKRRIVTNVAISAMGLRDARSTGRRSLNTIKRWRGAPNAASLAMGPKDAESSGWESPNMTLMRRLSARILELYLDTCIQVDEEKDASSDSVSVF